MDCHGHFGEIRNFWMNGAVRLQELGRSDTTLGAEEKLKTRSRVTTLDLTGRHLVTLVRTYVMRGGVRDGLRGLIVAGFAGMHTFVKYAKAWERLHAGKTDPRQRPRG